MKVCEILEATTKTGSEIILKRFEDVEGKRTNRGWRVDEVKAFVDGELAGYLKISYIPKEAFQHFYPSIINFVTQINGQPLLPYGKQHLPHTELNDDELRKLIEIGFHYNARWLIQYDYKKEDYKYKDVFLKEMTRKQLLDAVKDLKSLLTEKYKKGPRGFDWFKKYFVDRPLVDFIRVHNEHDRGSTRNWQRQGIGSALYKEGTKWMAERGMKLYGSQSPSDSAKATWDSMRAKGIVGKDRRGHYLDPSKVA